MKQVELKVLKLLLTRDFYLKHGKSLSTKVFPSEVKGLMKTITHLHNSTEAEELTIDEVYHLYESSETVTVARLALVKEILEQVDKSAVMSPEVTMEVVAKVHEKEAARAIADKALAIVQRNDGAMSLQNLKDYVADIDAEQDAEEVDVCATDIVTLKESKAQKGVFFFANGLEALHKLVPSLSRGHFAIVFASTNAGKSSFVAQQCVGYLQQGHKVLYFGNEDPAEDIVLNLVRSTEGKSEDDP